MFDRYKDPNIKKVKKLMEEFHSLNLSLITDDISERGTIQRDHMDTEIMYMAFRSQEKLNTVTNILVVFTIALVILTVVLLYFTIILAFKT